MDQKFNMMPTCNLIDTRSRLTLGWTLCLCVAASIWCSPVALGQNDAQGPVPSGMELLDVEPFDIVRFTEKAGGGAVRTLLFNFPNRKLPVNPKGKLVMSLVGLEGNKYEAAWKDIETIELWEKRLQAEVQKMIAAKRFDDAYPLLAILLRDYPQIEGLDQLRADYMYRNAADAMKQGQYKQTLAMLESLRQHDPTFNTQIVLRVIGAVTDKLIQELVDKGQLEYAQKLHARLENDYRDTSLSSIEKWSEIFLKMATEKRAAALAARERGDMRAARALSRESYAIWPRIEGGKALITKIDSEYPLVNVGVLQTATVFDPTRIDNWSARRAGRLLYRTLFEISGAGPEGGEYDFLFGDLEISDDRKELYFDIDLNDLPPTLATANSFNVSELLMNRARPDHPDYSAPWAALLDRIEIPTLTKITAYLNRPHVVPHALLQRKIDGGVFEGKPGSPTGAYRFDVQEEGVTRFVYTGKDLSASQPREIVEIELADSSDAVSGLLRGELDVVDQLFPADANRLRQDPRVNVVNYPLPSVHMLVPCSDHHFLADRTFRRALLYAIDRDTILSGELLANKSVQGCQVLSGPFPAGIELNDPLAYAYDESIQPRPYEPRLGNLLITMAKQQAAALAKRNKEKPPELKPIRIGYPATDIANVACEAIKTQLSLLSELEVETVKLPPGQTWPEPGQCDLVYVMASVWEPVADARRIVGPDGLAKSDSQLVGMGLRMLEMSKNWKDVRDGLRELHRISHHELPVLPLWQLVDSYAFRKDIRGIGRSNVTLYQSLDNWRLSSSTK
ncbi:Bacterial extracellular solute-binding proteins, family 5 Middle [Rosistilla ulvae]|uniref:Bacterial extracellular solute-binding proteins, family 5 Middle n=1 Tax=Rosistilla ulvae TaxID=1930277 RepID=A0A517M7D9_9BACT|nr:ABC transporter substrate-binding protein [Rosistilla ulvae]QDS90791.1 Bacterial extracellular solute-binding proteins, family 5 Middle [Rosistilla ulvae]